MNTKYSSYPKYKDSGVEWFDAVPIEWCSSRLKFETTINMGQSPNSDDCNQDRNGLPFLQGNAEFGVRYPKPKQYCPVARKVANIGDLLFSVRAPVGALNLADQMYGIGRGLCAINNVSGLFQGFLWWLIPVIKTELDSVSTGSTFEAVSAEQVENVVIFKPSIKEQQNISDFLDHETAKIDTLIEKQQQLIKLLKEKRQAVISHAVTKGLNSEAPMKDSGVEWLGEVPEHWNLSSLKHYWNVLDCKHLTAEFVDEGIPLASIREVKSWYVDLKNAKKTTEAYYDLLIDGNRKPNAGDIIYSRNATVGEAALVPSNIKFAMGQDVCLLSKISEFDSEFLLHQLKSPVIQLQLESLLIGSTFKRINVEEIRNFMICIPPVEEQNQITLHLRDRASRYDNLINKSEEVIELMKERRTALISAAVTGKIDVRNWESQPCKEAFS